MHELGIIIHISKTLKEVAEENEVTKIGSVTLEIGEVSGIVPEYLLDCWDYYRKKSDLLSESELRIETLPAVTMCENCKKTYPTVKFGRQCPYCKSDDTYLLTGNECVSKKWRPAEAGFRIKYLSKKEGVKMLFHVYGGNGIYQWIAMLAVLAGLILLNEFARRTKFGGLMMFGIIPLALTVYFVVIAVCAGQGVEWAVNNQTHLYMNGWFHYAKLYAALAGCIRLYDD